MQPISNLYRYLQEKHMVIQYFGLGFVQVKVGIDERYHFYSPRAKATINEEEIHNHKYGFTSNILYGELYQEFYQVTEGEEYFIKVTNCALGQPPHIRGKCGVKLIGCDRKVAGQSYTLTSEDYHRVMSTYGITHLFRNPIESEFACVLVRELQEDNFCPFETDLTKDDLWSIVKELCDLYQPEK